jgi:hypothetical protein
MVYQRPSIGDVVGEVKRSLLRKDESEALRLCFHFVEVYDRASPAERERIVLSEPDLTGDERFDALAAAIVEFCCARQMARAPQWVESPHRFLDRWWFVSGMRSLHANAIAHSPISFARRGVFITENALTYT